MADLDIGCLGTDASGRLQVVEPRGAPTQRFFRVIKSLSFKTGGVADAMTIDSDATDLRAVFNCHDYYLGVSDLDAVRDTPGAMTTIRLDGPRQVLAIQISTGTTLSPAGFLEFYRLDGNTPADSPTISVGVSDGLAFVPNGAGFVDARFAIRLMDSEGKATSPSVHAIRLRSYPTGPRLGIADPAKLEAHPDDRSLVTGFWQSPGVTDEASADLGIVDAGKKMAAALERFLNGLLKANPAKPPESINVALVIESDNQCEVEVKAFGITYHPRFESLPPADGKRVDKQVLRFPGDRVSSQHIPLQVPRTVMLATIRTVESFTKGDAVAAGDDVCLPGMLQSTSEGAYIGVEKWVAQDHVHTAPEAISVNAVVLGLMSISSKAELQIEVQEDWRGRPSGRTLAEGKVTLELTAGRCWSIVRFPAPVVMTSARHWIVVKAKTGSAIWLVQCKDSSVRVAERAGEKSIWSETSVLSGVQALYRFVLPGPVENGRPVTISIGDGELGLTEPQPDEPGVREFDMTHALKAHIAGRPADGPCANVELTFTAAGPGFITVYPPSIDYDV